MWRFGWMGAYGREEDVTKKAWVKSGTEYIRREIWWFLTSGILSLCACSTEQILILPKLSFNIFYSRQRMPIHPNLHISLSHTLRQPKVNLLLPPSYWGSAGKRFSARFFHYFLRSHTPRYPRIFSRTVKCRSAWFNAFAGCFARSWWKKDDKIRFGMCYKHIPKEYLRRKIIRIFRPNVFGSYFMVSFSAYELQAPEVALDQALLHLTSPKTYTG